MSKIFELVRNTLTEIQKSESYKGEVGSDVATLVFLAGTVTAVYIKETGEDAEEAKKKVLTLFEQSLNS